MNTTTLHLHQTQKETFFKTFRHRPHHAWILKGPKGIGKLDFAKQVAAQILTEKNPDPHINQKIDSQNQPNFLYISPENTDTKSISIEQIRKIFPFVYQTSHDENWKIIILNSLNALTINSANGLLKILEAPSSKTLFFLIHHNGAGIMPTLMSRCAYLSFLPIAEEKLQTLIPNEFSQRDQKVFLALARGCPNRLIELLDLNVINFYNSFQEAVMALLKSNDYQLAHTFAYTTGKDPVKLELFSEIIEWWLQNAVKEVALQNFSFFNIPCTLSSLINIQQIISKIISWKKNLDLDGRQFILNIFFQLKDLKTL